MHLDQLQHLLEEQNAVRAPLRVTEVLLAPAAVHALRGGRMRCAPEQVFARQAGADTLEIAVWIDPRLQCRLALADPRTAVTDGNLDALHGACEGISHFLALSHAAAHEREISALELELQGEVDKFVLSARLAADHGSQSLGCEALFARQFERVRFADDLDVEEQQRYRHAHRHAARLLRRWLNRYQGQWRHPALEAELRRFFRSTRAQKLRWAEAGG